MSRDLTDALAALHQVRVELGYHAWLEVPPRAPRVADANVGLRVAAAAMRLAGGQTARELGIIRDLLADLVVRSCWATTDQELAPAARDLLRGCLTDLDTMLNKGGPRG